jgi:WD40 repeat protein
VLATTAQVGDQAARIRLWNSSSGELLNTTFGLTDVAHLDFSPDGKSLAGLTTDRNPNRLFLRSEHTVPLPLLDGG